MATRKVTDKEFDDVLAVLAKSFGRGYNRKGLAQVDVHAIPTGHDDLDAVLTKGAHGIYQGGIIEMIGEEGSGKTSLALRTVGHAQRLGMRCCWIDAEAGWSVDLALLNGVDPEKLVIPELMDTKAFDKDEDNINFYSADQVLNMVYKTIITNAFGLVVIDSVAGLMPMRIVEKDYDGTGQGVGELAKTLADKLRLIVQACDKTETSLILINQLRDKVDMGGFRPSYGERFKTPGGRALKHFAHQRLGISRIGGKDGQVWSTDTDGEKELIGHYARVKIIKNKKAPPLPPGMQIEVPIYYRKYFPDAAKLVYDAARQLKVITIRNGKLKWKRDGELFLEAEGEASILQAIREQELEQTLAQDCVEAEKGERNNSLNIPVKLSPGVKKIAESGPSVKVETGEEKAPSEGLTKEKPRGKEEESKAKKTKTARSSKKKVVDDDNSGDKESV